MKRRDIVRAAGVGMTGIALAGCGDTTTSGDEQSTETPTETETETATPSVTPEPTATPEPTPDQPRDDGAYISTIRQELIQRKVAYSVFYLHEETRIAVIDLNESYETERDVDVVKGLYTAALTEGWDVNGLDIKVDGELRVEFRCNDGQCSER